MNFLNYNIDWKRLQDYFYVPIDVTVARKTSQEIVI